MSGAAGLAAARRRRGNPQPTPQRMSQQPPPVPQQHPRVPPVSPQGAAPTSPLDILHQHHIQLETHDKMLNELKSNLDTIKDLYATQTQDAAASMPSQTPDAFCLTEHCQAALFRWRNCDPSFFAEYRPLCPVQHHHSPTAIPPQK